MIATSVKEMLMIKKIQYAVVMVLTVLISGIAFADAVTDETGRVVVIRGTPERIVSLAPGITEILFALNLDDRIVGVTSFCDWPEKARQKESIGGFTNPSLEKIVSLKPDLIIATADGNRPETVRQLEKIGMTVYTTNPSDTAGILRSVLHIGAITGRSAAARELTAKLQNRLDAVSNRIKNRKKPRVFFQIGMEPVITVGKDTLISDVIDRAGGVNIAGADTARYPRYSAEGVMAGAPDILLFAPMATDREFKKVKKYWEQYPGIPAVKNKQIYPMNTDLIGRASPRIVDAIEQTAKILHPEGDTGPEFKAKGKRTAD
jgi:iron complex transport system substrate-binding protein